MSELLVNLSEENQDLEEKLRYLKFKNQHIMSKSSKKRMMEPFRRDYIEDRKELDVEPRVDYYENLE